MGNMIRFDRLKNKNIKKSIKSDEIWKINENN